MTRPTAAILLTGSELLRGVIPDRNAAYLAERLESLGFSMRRTLMVGDPLADIERGFRELAGAHDLIVTSGGLGPTHDDRTVEALAAVARVPLELAGAHDLIVTSGGLGPTHDDRTVEALAAVAGVPLELDESVLARITGWTDEVAQRMGFDRARFDAGNRKQARIPRGAQVLGMAGTAPGLVMEVDGSVVVVLPGVPSELRRLWQLAPEHPLLAPLIARAQPRQRLMLRTYGIGESHVADLFEQAGGDPDGVETSICARNYEVEIDIRSTAEGDASGVRLWQRLQSDLQPHLFATDERPIAEIVLELVRARGLTLVTAESCTGGMVAAELTAIPGSSDVFAGGAVTYSNRLKHELLGVPEATLEQHGAVSAETARAMAEGARRRLGADLAVAVTGVAGPGGGTEERPVGLVYLHVTGPDGEAERRMQWGGTRHDVRLRATAAALHLLRDHLATAS